MKNGVGHLTKPTDCTVRKFVASSPRKQVIRGKRRSLLQSVSVFDTGDDRVDRLGQLIEISGQWAAVHRAGDLPPLVSPCLSEMFNIDCGFWVYNSRYSPPMRPYVYHSFGVLEDARAEIQAELDRGQWFYRLGESIPLETWVEIPSFPEPVQELLSSHGVQHAGIWPIRFGDEYVGFLTFCRTTPHITRDDDIVHQCVLLITLVLNLIVLRRRAEFDSYTDPLTGLHNRRGLDRTWSQWRKQTKEHHRILVGMVDLDNLKQINDLDGHLAGDNALIYVAKWLRGVLGENSFLCRWGGDEFAFSVADDATILDAASLESRLNELGNKLPFQVSVGVASLEDYGFELEECLRIADERMYTAKNLSK